MLHTAPIKDDYVVLREFYDSLATTSLHKNINTI